MKTVNKIMKFTCVVMTVAVTAPSWAAHAAQPANTVTSDDVSAAQETWGRGLVELGKAYQAHKDYRSLAKDMINKLYAYNYDSGVVLFKPTVARKQPFRPTMKGALSYFIAGKHAKYSEDGGFALRPWKSVFFQNDRIFFHGDVAVAMGHYTFTPYSGKPVVAEYTLGYVKNPASGNLKIFLQHSSLPHAK